MSGLKVFGADWCGYTKKFSADFSADEVRYADAGVSVEYINCAKDDETSKMCVDRGIKGFPTFENSCGQVRAGYAPTDANISFATGCTQQQGGGSNVPEL